MSWRAIHDTVAASESLAALSHGAERLYWRLLAETDSYGRLRGEPSKVKATCMPIIAVHLSQIREWLEELEEVDRIIRYQDEGREYIQITDFDVNQPTEFLRRRGKERYPSPPKRRPFTGDSRTTPDYSGSTQDHSGLEAEAEAEEKQLSSSTSSLNFAPADPAAFEKALKDLGWRRWQISQAHEDPDRAYSWSVYAATHANGNPGGYAWAGFTSGDWPKTSAKEDTKMNVVDACQAFIESHGWDETYDQDAMIEEFGRIERGRRTEGTIGNALQGLLEQWAATRQDRYGIKADLTA